MRTLNSKVILAKNIKLDKAYKNILTYTESNMVDLVTNNAIYSNNTYQYIKPGDNNIIVDANYNTSQKANYIAFQNPDYSNKWFFGFIDSIEYNAENSTKIHYIIDVHSTWYDYWTRKSCFVIREHVNNDTIGLNTIPENIDSGEPIEESSDRFDIRANIGTIIEESLITNSYYIISSTYDPLAEADFTGVSEINNNIFGSKFFAFDNTVDMANFLAKINSKGKIESVQNVFLIQKYLVDTIGKNSKNFVYNGATVRYWEVDPGVSSYVKDPVTFPWFFSKTTSFSDFTPKNNKCYCYPYNYLLATNNIGNQNIYKYEDFLPLDYAPSFEIQMAFQIGSSVRLVPRGYKNIDYNYDESLPLGKLPTGGWSSDAFTNWLTQNAVNVGTNIASAVVSAGVSIATQNYAGLIGVAGSTASLIGSFNKANLLPSIRGGNNTGDINYSSQANTFVLHHMRSKTEYMRVVDSYFSKFGYKINQVKLPNITGRVNWNYVQIGQDDCIGYCESNSLIPIPAEDMEKINQIYRNGVTCWHSHSNLGNYALSNAIV